MNLRYYEGPAERDADVCLHQRYFTFRSGGGWVAGKNFNVMFTIERCAAEVWPQFKDFNRWQNAYGHYYSGVLGDLEGKTFRLSEAPNETGPDQYKVTRVIPEHLIVLFQTIPEFGSAAGMSPDCHVFMLNEHAGKTVITALMEHASFAANVDEEEALAPWREVAPESHRKWRESFIPGLKKLVYGERRA